MVDVGSSTSRLGEVEMWLTGYVDQPTNQLHMKRPMGSDNRGGLTLPTRARTAARDVGNLTGHQGNIVGLWATQGTHSA